MPSPPVEAKAHFEKLGTFNDLFEKMVVDGSGYVSRDEAKAFHEKLKAQSAKEATLAPSFFCLLQAKRRIRASRSQKR